MFAWNMVMVDERSSAVKQLLQPVFWEALSSHPKAPVLWEELCAAYSQPHRTYHNLLHLQNMYEVLYPYQKNVPSWQATLLALFYHDVVYEPTSPDNETQSALLAKSRLQDVVSEEILLLCEDLILATANHSQHGLYGVNVFIGADLAILGNNWPTYLRYAKNIRKEYQQLHDEVYRSGRITVLNNFIQRERIFYAEPFFKKYEIQARENMARELQILEQGTKIFSR
ncbi:MAG: hypothetical protein J0L94_05585 [Rhodothermia bacterium]|nr:hypothetical protein [Rhodothermia bacterium]